MLGFACGCCAAAGALVIINAASDPIKPSQIFLLEGMMNSHVLIGARLAAFSVFFFCRTLACAPQL
jgi:hypothetical protein